MSYTKVGFMSVTGETREILIAELAELEYDGFEEEEEKLSAYISSSLFDKNKLKQLAEKYSAAYEVSELQAINWNQLWESNFEPVTVAGFCMVRADFHDPATETRHEIIITPKMSFGTGHHATTYMMIQQMEHMDLVGKQVLDFGTGTGILAILAVKSGAADVLAVDNDDWSIENAAENFRRNNTTVDLRKASTAAMGGHYDIILANITRNVIINNFSAFRSGLADGGTLLLSGLLREDEEEITVLAGMNGFIVENVLRRENWICLKFKILFGQI